MRKLALLLSLVLFIGLQTLTAQTKALSGKIVDNVGDPVPGVSIVVKGTTIGTISGPDGTYQLNVPADAGTIVYTFIGMQTQEVTYTGQTKLNVFMLGTTEDLDEVVVTALGISKAAKAIGYSSTSVSGSDIAQTQAVNPVQALQGKVAGMQVTTGANPGSSPNVMIRGTSSFGSNQPLFIVDGMPLVNSQNANTDNLNNYVDYGTGINAINPDDIENMTVLKGAAATALYGSRAANGVVLITTKSGKNTNGKMKITYDGGVGFTRVSRLPDDQKSFGQGWSGLHALDENGNWGARYDGRLRKWGRNIDNTVQVAPYSYIEDRVRDFFDYGMSYKNAVSAFGGSDVTNYFVSFSQNSVDGVYPDDVDKYDRYTLSVKASHKTDKMKLSFAANYTGEETSSVAQGQGTSVYRSIYEVANNISLVDLKKYKEPFNSLDNYFTPYGVNPYWVLNENSAIQKKNKFFGKFDFDYNLLDNLTLQYRFGGDFELANQEQAIAKIQFTEDSYNDGSSTATEGSYVTREISRYETNHDLQLNYNSSFDAGIDLNVLVGGNLHERGYRRLEGSISSIDVDGFYRLPNSLNDAIASQDLQTKRMRSVYGSVDLGYKNYLFVNLTARNDWSSTLPLDNNSFFYPGITGSFLFTELLGNTGPVNYGKLRVAYGWTGNDAPLYAIYPEFLPGTIYMPGYPDVDDLTFPLGGVNGYEVANSLGSPTLEPEITKEIEAGLEMRFFNNRIGFDISVYDKTTEGLIESLPIDPSSGYTSQVVNLADVRNYGTEIAINTTPLKLGDFRWDLDYTFSTNKNKVKNLPTSEVNLGGFGGVGIYAVEGKEMGVFKSNIAKIVTLDNNMNPATSGTEYVVVDGNGNVQPSTQEELTDKTINEDYAMGLTNTFSWKGLSLSGTLDYHKGGYMFSNTKDYMHWTGSAIESTMNDRNPFIVPGSVVLNADGSYSQNTTPVTMNTHHNFYGDYGAFESDEYNIIDRSFVKLRQVVLSYTLPKSIYSKWNVDNVRMSLVAANILLWTPADNPYVDPEVTTFGTDVEARFGEFMSNPSNQTYTFSLSIGF